VERGICPIAMSTVTELLLY